jgi:hypothetical protein
MSRILARVRQENEDLRARLLAANNEVNQLRAELAATRQRALTRETAFDFDTIEAPQ